MTEGPKEDLDFARDLDTLTYDGLMDLAARIERSTTLEHLIYRELEIDQVWRLLDEGVVIPGFNVSEQNDCLQQIEQIHDLIGVSHDPRRAAAKLRAILADRSTKGVDHVDA